MELTELNGKMITEVKDCSSGLILILKLPNGGKRAIQLTTDEYHEGGYKETTIERHNIDCEYCRVLKA